MRRINRRLLSFISAFFSAAFVHQVFAQPTIDPNAQVVYLRKSCLLQGTTYQDNCFESTAALTNWLWGSSGTVRTNQPGASDRVHVEVGPGDFGAFECAGKLADNPRKGYVSIDGSGREATRFVRTAAVTTGINGADLNGVCRGGIQIEHCDGLEFSDIGADGPSGAFWLGAGKGVWNDVDLIGESGICPAQASMSTAAGWYDQADGASAHSLQYFFGSRMWVNSGASAIFGLGAFSSEIWLYASDVAALLSSNSPGGGAGILVNNSAAIHMFGGSVRVVGAIQHAATSEGVYMAGGTFHMHGGTISVDLSGSTGQQTLIGLYADPAAAPVFAHTPGTAFSLVGGTTEKHIFSQASTYSASIMSPFLWRASDTPPEGGSNSLQGQDIFVDTSANGTNEAHVMVHDNTCSGTGGSWRDMSNGQCRTQ